MRAFRFLRIAATAVRFGLVRRGAYGCMRDDGEVAQKYCCHMADAIADPEKTATIGELIKEGAYYGMQTFDQHLVALIREPPTQNGPTRRISLRTRAELRQAELAAQIDTTRNPCRNRFGQRHFVWASG